jgi:hypothetical protein
MSMLRNTSASAPSTGVEFTEQDPLLVTVGIIEGNWDIQSSSTDKFPRDGKPYSDKMEERVGAIPGGRLKLKKDWASRRIAGAASPPQFIDDPKHYPIVVRPGEHVRFQCDYPFSVAAHRDQTVSPSSVSPDSPFVWPVGQQSRQPQAPYFVIGVAQGNLSDQRFYKSQAVIIVNGQMIFVDPDTIGTTDGGN